MNNEPVAWIWTCSEDGDKEYLTRAEPRGTTSKIPLYTHPADESFDRTASHMAGEYVSYPAKTLTDEEIHNLFLSFCNVGFTQVDEIGFARAILRKAQEK